jgi:hypothetical protein
MKTSLLKNIYNFSIRMREFYCQSIYKKNEVNVIQQHQTMLNKFQTNYISPLINSKLFIQIFIIF